VRWEDVFGSQVSASEMLTQAREQGLELEEFLARTYEELRVEDPQGGYDANIDIDALAEQVREEALEDHIHSLYGEEVG